MGGCSHPLCPHSLFCMQVAAMAAGRVLVGHQLSKDLKVLLLSHPRKDLRDTAR